MFGSSGAPVTLVKASRSLFHLLKGLSVRMEQATASSDAVEIRLQELRSSSLTRGREWLQGALEEISALELRKMASARNVGRGPDKKWLAVGELRSIVGSLGTPNAGGVWQKRDMTKVECLLHGSMLSDECCFVVAVCCMLLACRKLDRLPDWKNFA